jgi:hypothetical protein
MNPMNQELGALELATASAPTRSYSEPCRPIGDDLLENLGQQMSAPSTYVRQGHCL